MTAPLTHTGEVLSTWARPIPNPLLCDFAALCLLEPEPELHQDWIARLNRKLERHARARPWNILRVSPNMERKVRDALSDAGLTVYVPIEKYRPPNHWRPRTRPLIPGYLFALLPDDDALDTARKNHAVREVMCADGKPVQVPALHIGALVLSEACHAFDRTWRWSGARKGKGKSKGRRQEPISRWKSGERVKVNEGPFAGFEGTIVDVRRQNRMGVLITIFGRVTEAELDDDWLEPAGLVT
jgi:transcription antitermination factor NusG